ncbi:MAG TPA: DUF790 family protein, partial [Polyangiaceae bacterium]
MLSAEHVRARKDRDRLVLQPLSDSKRRRALEIAARLIEEAQTRAGARRDELEAAFATIEIAPTERRLAQGLIKLVEDACEFRQLEHVEPAAMRSELFLRAAKARREASLEAPFSREGVLEQTAAVVGMDAGELEESIYADLRGEQRLVRGPMLEASALIARYEQAQVQAVLLRAVEVVARVRCRSPDAYRALFHKLKFRQLLYRLERLEEGDYSIVIDGPFSLFEAVTKYGLELALTLPALEACDVLELSARVLWGKSRTPLRFEHRHACAAAAAPLPSSVRDDVRALLEEFQSLESP